LGTDVRNRHKFPRRVRKNIEGGKIQPEQVIKELEHLKLHRTPRPGSIPLRFLKRVAKSDGRNISRWS